MKKAVIASTLLFISLASYAQDAPQPLVDRELIFDIVHVSVVLLILYMITNFILMLLKQNFDYRIKNKVIEKDTTENIVRQLVQPPKKDPRPEVLQWLFVLAGIGLGFTIMYFAKPYGIHSLAIMAFCLAAGFGGYYLSIKSSSEK
jgi:hypothetical protein